MPLFDLPPWLLSAILAPFGLVIGSFGNVLIHRLPQEAEEERNVITKGSHCPSCKAPIKPWHNIPLFGWLWLRGRCAACGWRIPFRYPLVEALSGLIFGISPWILPFGTLIWLKAVVCGYALLVLFFTDLEQMILPDAVQFPLMALGLLFTLPQMLLPLKLVTVQGAGGFSDLLRVELWHNGLQPAPAWRLFGGGVTWQASLAGMAVGYGAPALMNLLYKLIRKTDGLGMGDFKMLAWLGAFWGFGPMLGILFLGAGLGAAVGLPLMLLRRAGGQTMLPFGCFLALATPIVVFWGPGLWAWYSGFLG
ncbi:MAG TPA: prepilin peptidase [Holophagaceae bacterium]|nr:prepilin peptidase [Holophagaceae bacterium]